MRANSIEVGLRKIFDRFSLKSDMQNEEAIVSELTRGSEISGTNLWLLISAILIASVGLNVNSTAVIIGAMLISPLMGPILGVALGVATYRFTLIQSAARSLGFAVAASVLASTTYFLISPVAEAQSELLARTNPSVWDVLIAVFGGLAGMIGVSRKQPGNVIPGVAIATALMPPLCTAGFGLATAQWEYFLGAFYLFFINSVFICLGGILILKLLRLHPEQVPDQKVALILKRATIGISLIAIIPSFFVTYRIVREALFRSAANRFVSAELSVLDLAVVSRDISYASDRSRIRLTYLGPNLAKEKVGDLQSKLNLYGLVGTELILKSAIQEGPEESLKVLRSGLLEELLQKTRSTTDAKDARIKELEAKLAERTPEDIVKEIGAELAAQMRDLESYSLARIAVLLPDGTQAPDQWVLTGRIQTGRPVSKAEKQRIQKWLQVRFRVQEADLRFF